MLVNYKKVNCWGIGVPVKQVKGLPTRSKSVNLIPGVNKIDDKDWALIKSHPRVVHALKEGYLVVVTDKDGAADKSQEAGSSAELYSLDGKVKEKVAIIKECYHKELLEKWQEEEESAGCQTAIAKQLKNLELTDEEKAAMKK